MKKKLLSVALSTIMVLSMATVAFAAGSPSASTVTPIVKNEEVKAEVAAPKTKAPAEYVQVVSGTKATVGGVEVAAPVIEAVPETTVAATVAEVIAQLNDVLNVAEKIESNELKVAATDATKKIVPEIKAVVEVKAPEGVVVSAENPITLTFPAPGVKATSNIMILHWDGSKWETIKAIAGDGTVTATFTSLSPIAIVELTVENASNTTTNTTTNTTVTPDTTSPKTAAPVAVLPVMLVSSLAGAVVCKKKLR